MARTKKITQNINKDAGLLDLPRVRVPRSQWSSKHSNYLTCNIGEIVPIYVDECLPNERRRITMGQLSHMSTPIAPIMNSQYTEFRSFWIPYRLCSDLLNGYTTRKSPWVKVFGEDNATANANIIVPLANQKLPSIHTNLNSDFTGRLETFGGIADALGYESDGNLDISEFNFLDMAAYELIYQYKYRNQNREAATNSDLYKWLCGIYSRTSAASIHYSDKFHTAQREKDYFTGSAPFTQKSSQPMTVNIGGEAVVKANVSSMGEGLESIDLIDQETSLYIRDTTGDGANLALNFDVRGAGADSLTTNALYADLTSAKGISIEDLRLLIKLQEALEKDALYGSDYASSLNSRFGTCPMSLIVEEPLELKKVTITSQMQPIFQTSSTASESTILGTIGANATTQSGEFEIVPLTEFKEYGILMICAVHKAQNSYDSVEYKPKRIFKKSRFDFYTPELNDLGFQPIQRKEFSPGNYEDDINEAVSFNEAWAEYRFGNFNKVHGMFEPSRSGALDYWTLAVSNVADVQSLYKQGTTELDRAVSVSSSTAPQFFDAYGFIEYNDKPMSLHSIPGMDGVI